MSSPAFSFSPWRRRGSSVHSSDRGTEDPPTNQQTAPAPPGQPQALDSRLLSSSISSAAHREPIRSFIQGSFREYHVPVESVQQHARSVREDTAELATYQLSDHAERRSPSFLSRQRSLSLSSGRIGPGYDHVFEDDDSSIPQDAGSDTIPEVSEPPSPEDTGAAGGEVGPSLLAHMLRQSPPSAMETATQHDIVEQRDDHSTVRERRLKKASIPSASSNQDTTETTPLLGSLSPETQPTNGEYHLDLEGQKARVPRRIARAVAQLCKRVGPPFVAMTRSVKDPKLYSRRSLWENGIVAPVACLPAVIVGLLLNILDALSYGMILFPLGNPIFAHLGSAGISIFYVSTIVAQLTFSCGSVFRGGVGSELIEVVPFFHSMAAKITASVGEDNPEAVIATTIVAYALSSMLTGTVFFCMGKFKFGYLVGFIPRHILIGCIGGVGWFLVATGFEVSARIEGSLEYNLDTLYKLMSPETIPLWVTPLCLAIVLFWGQKRTNNKYFLPLYIIAIPIIFYFFVLSLDALDTNTLRDGGWIFEGPPAGEPWWYFYTLYQFNKVQWAALLETVPAMFALTFFGILHVPINVPALALNTGEDHADLDRELKLHGYSNFLSGACGSIQNYLVYANTVFFMRSGGDSRLAGFELAALTFGVMTIGPALIGYIPIMMVGCLIFDLGFELLLEAVWQPRKKFKLPEYVTVIAIVLIMGIYDFVVGIGVGILLAFVSMILQTSRVSAIRTAYSGEIVNSTVRRNPSQQHYLKQVGKQIQIIKLAGYLFFGTIVGVENRIRSLIAEETFSHRPIRYLILDLHQVTGLDYSAGEAFNTISRLLDGKGIHLVLSGLDDECSLARDLRAVGLGDGGIDVSFLPNLNSALESCENELLKTFYASQEALRVSRLGQAVSLDVPSKPDQLPSGDLLASSPRLNQLQEAAKVSLNKAEVLRLSRWQNFKEPLRLILQIFQDLSDKNEDFWFRAVGYFVRKECASGSILFRRGEPADGFYLVEKGILRADYDLPHGQYFHESIVAGTTCGELPFFSETTRTATACAELDCVVWVLNNESWKRLQTDDPDVAQELLKIGLKLTAERMNTVPASTMLMAE